MLSIDVTGYVAKDSEVRKSQDGENYTSFSVAVSIGTRTAPVTEWVNAICKGKLSEISALYVKKGVKVFLRGRPSSGFYVKDGKTIAILRVLVSQLEWFGNSTAQPAPNQNTNANNNLNSDLPY